MFAFAIIVVFLTMYKSEAWISTRELINFEKHVFLENV